MPPPPPLSLFFFSFLAAMKGTLTITLETWTPRRQSSTTRDAGASPLGGSGLRSGSSLGGGAVMLLVLHSLEDERS